MHPSLQLTLDRSPATYRPGETLTGTAQWSDTAPGSTLAIRLYLTTSGRAESTTVVVQEQSIPSPARSGQKAFSFPLPTLPPTFTGQLISVDWGVELVVLPGSFGSHASFILSQTGSAIHLPGLTPPKKSRLGGRSG